MSEEPKKSPLKEITQPFIDLMHAPRALWGINLAYLIEGFVYFGMLGYLAMYFNDYAGLSDVWAARMVMVLTAGITISMFFFGGLADRWGVRVALLGAFVLMIFGRSLLSAAPYLGLGSDGSFSPFNLIAIGGILLVVLGYGMYQPAAYAGVRQFTTKKTAAMGYAMLYALMNLGGWLPSFFAPIRNRVGISGAYWVYTCFTVLALGATMIILTRRTVEKTIADAKREREKEEKADREAKGEPGADEQRCLNAGCLATNAAEARHCARCGQVLEPAAEKAEGDAKAATDRFDEEASGAASQKPFLDKVYDWIVNHPLLDLKFSFFIFALIPVQTLFAHNWLTLPMYVERAYRDSWPWISKNFEPAVNFNPLLIFILVPIVTALTQKRKIYNMMILGTFVMAAPTFLLAIGAKPWTLVSYLIIMTIGEAMWQPRFLQYAAEIAPEGRTGAYMGVAQFPWFMTKMIVPLYSGRFLERYCPKEGVIETEPMWIIYGLIAISSTVILILAKGWAGKDFKTQAA